MALNMIISDKRELSKIHLIDYPAVYFVNIDRTKFSGIGTSKPIVTHQKVFVRIKTIRVIRRYGIGKVLAIQLPHFSFFTIAISRNINCATFDKDPLPRQTNYSFYGFLVTHFTKVYDYNVKASGFLPGIGHFIDENVISTG